MKSVIAFCAVFLLVFPSAHAACPAVRCRMICEFGYASNKSGCEICECNPGPCKSVNCSRGNVCVAEPNRNCNGLNCTSMVGVCRPKVICPPICIMGCKYGNVIDENGCPICQCRPDPCSLMRCSHGTTCQVVPNSKCNGTMCPPFIGVCKPFICPAVCDIFCKSGNVMDENGCKTCACLPDPGELTVACPPVCEIYCEYGNFQDRNACPICKCRPNPCSIKFCPMNQICKVVPNIICKGPRCPPYIGVCRPICPPVCMIFCQFGNVLDKNGCPICKCKPDPGIIAVTCPPPPACAVECKFGNVVDKNGCRTCKCLPDPCLNYECPKNQTCVPESLVQCIRAPCPPYVPKCYKN